MAFSLWQMLLCTHDGGTGVLGCKCHCIMPRTGLQGFAKQWRWLWRVRIPCCSSAVSAVLMGSRTP